MKVDRVKVDKRIMWITALAVIVSAWLIALVIRHFPMHVQV